MWGIVFSLILASGRILLYFRDRYSLLTILALRYIFFLLTCSWSTVGIVFWGNTSQPDCVSSKQFPSPVLYWLMLAFILLLFVVCLVLRRRYRIPQRLMAAPTSEELLVPRLTERQVSSLKQLMKRGSLDSCPICIMDFEVKRRQEREKRVVLPECGHEYHFACLSDWLNINPVCPCCKRDVRNEL